MAAEELTAIVAGGGIAGLASAVALDQAGWRVTVLERAPAFGEVGAGLALTANGMAAVDALAWATPYGPPGTGRPAPVSRTRRAAGSSGCPPSAPARTRSPRSGASTASACTRSCARRPRRPEPS